MNRNAFTLVELLAVLTLIAVLSVITVPIVSNSINSSKDSLHNDQEKMILKAAINWAGANTDRLPINSDNEQEKTIAVTLGYLKSQGYVISNIKDPKTGYLYPNDLTVSVSYNDNTNDENNCEDQQRCMINGKYKFVLSNDQESISNKMNLEQDIPAVELKLCGMGDIDVDRSNYNTMSCVRDNLDLIYQDYSSFYDVSLDYFIDQKTKLDDNSLVSYGYPSDDIKTINMSKYGFYYVYYNDINSPDKTELKIFMISDLEPPTIDYSDLQTEYSVGDEINLNHNVSCTDNSGYCTIKTSGNINPSVRGKYVVYYIASDHSGNTVKEKKVITVN